MSNTTASFSSVSLSRDMNLSVVLPVHSEQISLKQLVARLHDLLQTHLHEIIIIVAPQSPTETFDIVEQLSQQHPRVRYLVQSLGPGLGSAVRQGLAEASGTHVLMMDSDGEMDPATVPHMIRKMQATNCDLVVASRWLPGGGVVGYDRLKYLLNRAYQFMFRLLYRTRIHDLTLGFKLATIKVIRAFEWDSTYHEIAAETTLRPIRHGYHVEEVPTVWVRRAQGTSRNPFRRNFRYVRKAVQIRFSKSSISQPVT